VGTLVLNKLERHLAAKELGKLARPGTFFDFTQARPRMRIVDDRRVLVIPNSNVHYAHNDESGKDYLFLHLREPQSMAEDYTDAVVSLLRLFDVTEYCRIGGMFDSVPHTRPLLVTGTLSEPQADGAKGLVSTQGRPYQGSTSIVNLVSESLTDIQNSSLMVHLPHYAQLDRDHMGAFRLMEALCALYGFPDSLADPKPGNRQYEYIDQLIQNNSEVLNVLKQMESDYDQKQVGGQPQDEPAMSPDVEKFLREMSQRLADSQDGGE
jgi:hypothetical protein